MSSGVAIDFVGIDDLVPSWAEGKESNPALLHSIFEDGSLGLDMYGSMGCFGAEGNSPKVMFSDIGVERTSKEGGIVVPGILLHGGNLARIERVLIYAQEIVVVVVDGILVVERMCGVYGCNIEGAVCGVPWYELTRLAGGEVGLLSGSVHGFLAV
jgi:hypothetical protein